jgi:hypothetical protein
MFRDPVSSVTVGTIKEQQQKAIRRNGTHRFALSESIHTHVVFAQGKDRNQPKLSAACHQPKPNDMQQVESGWRLANLIDVKRRGGQEHAPAVRYPTIRSTGWHRNH